MTQPCRSQIDENYYPCPSTALGKKLTYVMILQKLFHHDMGPDKKGQSLFLAKKELISRSFLHKQDSLGLNAIYSCVHQEKS